MKIDDQALDPATPLNEAELAVNARAADILERLAAATRLIAVAGDFAGLIKLGEEFESPALQFPER